MNLLPNYSMVIYPTYRYVTIDCNVEFIAEMCQMLFPHTE